MSHEEKLNKLAATITEQKTEAYKKAGNKLDPAIFCTATVKPGKKYTKIDIGLEYHCSARYMVDLDGNIYGTKGYGVIHRGHHYGTLDTIEQYNWSGYVAVKR